MGNGTDNDSHVLMFNNGACAIARDANDLELHAYNAMVFGVSNTSYPSSTERMRIDSSGNVGIGTSAPSAKLDVSGSIKGSSDLTIDNGSISLTYDVSAGELNHAGATFHINKTNGVDVAIGNDDLYVDMSTSRVGIGTTSPQVALHVSHATAPSLRLSRTGTGQIYQFGIDSSGRFLIQEAASEGGTRNTRFVIDDSGEIGI